MRIVLFAVVLCVASSLPGCSFFVPSPPCVDPRDCPEGDACVSGRCVAADDTPLQDAGPLDGGAGAPDGGGTSDAAVLDGPADERDAGAPDDGGPLPDDGGPVATDAGPPAPPCGAVGALSPPWSASADGWPWVLDEEAGGLWQLGSDGATASLGGVAGAAVSLSTTSSAYSLAHGRVALRVEPPPPGVETWLALYPWGGAGLRVSVKDGALSATLHGDDGALVYGNIAYDAVAHRWWQARDDGERLYLEASPDGVTWSVLVQGASPAYTELVHVGFGAARAEAAIADDAVAFGPFIVDPAAGSYCPLASLVEGFDELPPVWRRIEVDGCAIESVAGAARVTHTSAMPERCGLVSLRTFSSPPAGGGGEVTVYGARLESAGTPVASIYLWDPLARGGVYLWLRPQGVEAFVQGPAADPSWEPIGAPAVISSSVDLRFQLSGGAVTFSYRPEGQSAFDVIGTHPSALSGGPLQFGFVLRDDMATLEIDGVNTP